MGDFRLRRATIAVPARPGRLDVVKYCRVPSPIGHALAGIAAGCLVAPAPHQRTAVVTRVLVFAAAGVAPDLDLLVGVHSGPSHGVGAALLVGLLAWIVVRGRGDAGPERPGLRSIWMAAAVAAAYATHTLLDWLGTDSSSPIGIMALWPFSHEYYESSLHVFMAISRRYWLPEFWTYNLHAIARELVILLPVLWIVTRLRRAGCRS